jgi:L-threonylcarbamoyladenylate synthase
VGIESTIIGCEEGNPVVYRLGGKSVEKIEAIIGPVEIRTREYPGFIAPGMLKSHYAPAKKVILFDTDLPAMNVEAVNAGILSFNKLRNEVPVANQYMLSGNSDLKEAGKNLFTGLRFLDSLDIQIIYAELVPETGIGKAINDRLRRAAAKH